MKDNMVRVCPICESAIGEKVNNVYTCDICGSISRKIKHIPSYRVGIEIKYCANCGDKGSDRRLHVHHIDGNHYNNIASNRIVLCWKCHRALHWGKWKLSDIGLKDPIVPPLFHGYNLS